MSRNKRSQKCSIRTKKVSLKCCAQICLHPCQWAFLLCQDNPSTWQVWYIKWLIKQHDHYTCAPCAGENKRPLKCAVLSHNKMPQMSQVLRERAIGVLTAGMSTRAVAREFKAQFSTISHLQCRFIEFGSTSNQTHKRKTTNDFHWRKERRTKVQHGTYP